MHGHNCTPVKKRVKRFETLINQVNTAIGAIYNRRWGNELSYICEDDIIHTSFKVYACCTPKDCDMTLPLTKYCQNFLFH